MKIKDSHIKEAEDILIAGNSFDEIERVPFIKNLETIDLLAVPGSGKTTALIAKLYCLSKQMPFEDGSGILVLSHTNAAVDEIESKLKPYCPQLFQYPNFVGTVQGFVNSFLAVPYFTQLKHSKINVIDNDAYYREMDYYLNLRLPSDVQYFANRDKSIFYSVRYGIDQNGKIYLLNSKTGGELKLSAPAKWVKDGSADKRIKDVYKFIFKLKNEILDKGIMNYDDCYFLAFHYIYKFPNVKKIIQNRFSYVFIDEAQDLDPHQLALIDTVFYTDDSYSVIQRIGDPNQSIYSTGAKVKIECGWQTRNEKYLTDSNRLTQAIADVVDCFTLNRHEIGGVARFQVRGTRDIGQIIPPHLLLFDKDTIGSIKPKFEDIIKEYNLHDTLEGRKYGFKIIGWSGSWDDKEPNGFRLEQLFPDDYCKKSNSIKETCQLLSEYLQYYPKYQTLFQYRKNILDAFCTVLRLGRFKMTKQVKGREVQRYLTSNTIFSAVKQLCTESGHNSLSESDFFSFKESIYLWSKNLATNNNLTDVFNEIKQFILYKMLVWFNVEPNKDILQFIGEDYQELPISEQLSDSRDRTDLFIPIDIKTVHSVKGQTHCATMYIETSYHSYESEKLNSLKKKATKQKPAIYYNNPLLKQYHNFPHGDKIRAQEAMKMMYVGFSRPTHLLCLAGLKNNYIDVIDQMESCGWKIVDITG